MPRARALPLVSALLAAAAAVAQVCVPVPPVAPFALPDYTGTWYEIGKIQTFGGAIFESSCVCTQLIVTPAPPGGAPGDASVVNSCRDKTPAGEFINATAQLVNMGPPGHWDETFLPPVFKGEPPCRVVCGGGEGGARWRVCCCCCGSAPPHSWGAGRARVRADGPICCRAALWRAGAGGVGVVARRPGGGRGGALGWGRGHFDSPTVTPAACI